jgi:molybdate transport system ATP-binding protein
MPAMSATSSSCHSANPFISLDNVSIPVHNGARPKRICWQILDDQHWAVVGPNGSGKSTLMQMICGRLPASEGRVVYHFLKNGGSQDRAGQSARPQDHIAYVAFDSQRLALGSDDLFHQARWNSGASQDALSVAECLSESRVRHINPFQVLEGRPEPSAFLAQKKQVIDLLGLEALLDRTIVQISNGERRKVVLAGALLKNPRLLILDNPFAGLDMDFRGRLEQIIDPLTQGEMRLILVTSGRDQIPRGITHVLLMERDGVIVQGPSGTMLSGPARDRAVSPGRPARFDLSSQDHQSEGQSCGDQVLVHIQNANVSYAGVRVLEGITWTVRRGENWALLGPNGAGKTTLLSLILADNPQAYANDITLFGRRRGSGESIWEIKQQIGWVAPELHLYYPRDLTCLDVVCSGFFDSIGRHQRCSEMQCETAMQWMQRFGLLACSSRAFRDVSEGEQRLILIIRALVKHPQLLILDEPCQALDVHNRDRVVEAVEFIGNHLHTGVIYVTHCLDDLPGTITHVLRLHEGKVVDQGRMDATRMKSQ